MALKQPIRRPGGIRRGPTGPDPDVVYNRSRGALLGLAVGDAFGSTNESRRFPNPPFPEMFTGLHTEMKGQGPHQLKPGQVTDETQMACCIGASLHALGKYDAQDVVKRYLAWRPHAFSVDDQVAQALDEMPGGRMHLTAAKQLWLRSARRAAGNNALARTAPIGVFFAKDEAQRIQASLDDSALTHFDPRSQLSCAALNGAIARAITQVKPLEFDDLVEGATADATIAGAIFARSEQAQEFSREATDAGQWLRDDLQAARSADPLLFGPELHLFTMMGFVRVAFRLAFWELFHAPSFEAALIDVVNRGGDTDTNAAITGALLGAYYGADQIPERWATQVLQAVPAQRGPLLDVYHPNALLGLVDG